MKKSLLTTLGLCLLTMAASAALDVKLSESFESGSMPAGWTQVYMSDNHADWIAPDDVATNPVGAYDGTGRAALRNTTGTTMNYVTRLITPALNLQAGKQYLLSFAYAQPYYSGDIDSLKVYYSANGSSWTLLQAFVEEQDEWAVVSLPLIAPSATYYIAFEGYASDGYGVLLDDVRVTKVSECANAEILLLTAKGTSADMIYETTPSGATVQVMVDSLERDMSTFNVAEAMFYTETSADELSIPNLQPDRIYYAYIRSICGDNESGYTEWVKKSFRTGVAFPFVEEFISAIPSNWENLSGAINAQPVANSSSYSWKYSSSTITGSAHVYGQSNGTPTWLATPPIDISSVEPGTPMELSCLFALSSSSYSASEVSDKSKINFHIMMSNDGGDTWNILKTYPGSSLSADKQRLRINLSHLVGVDQVVKFAFVADAQSTSAYFHLDEVKLAEFDANCGGASNLTISNVSDMGAIAKWDITGKDSVIVELSTNKNFNALLLTDTIDPADHQFVFDGLDNGTTYYVRVQQVCPDADWVSASFTTAIGVPFAPTFSYTIPAGWQRWSGTSAKFFADSATSTTSGWGLGNSYAFTSNYHWSTEVYSTTYNYWLTSPAVYLNPAAGDNAMLQFDMALTFWNSSSSAAHSDDDRVWVVISEDGGATWSRANATLWSGAANDNPDYDYNALTPSGTTFQIDLTPYMGKSISVAFGVETPVAGTDTRVHIHNIILKAYDPNCSGMKSVSASADIHEAVIRWELGGNKLAKVHVSTSAAFTDTVLVSEVSGVDTFLVENLNADTVYYYRVHQNCADFTWADALSASFTTHCEADTIPYVMDFESVANNATPDCWTIWREGGEYPCVASNSSYSVYSKNGSKYLSYGTSSSSYYTTFACLPAFTQPVNTLEMSFFARNYSSSTSSSMDVLQVGVMSDPMDTTTFVPMATIKPVSTSYEEYFVSFASYSGAGKYIAIKNKAGYYHAYIDSISVYNLPTCYRIGEVKATTVTAHGATLKFDLTNAADYLVVVATESINPDSAAASAADKVVYNEIIQGVTPAGIVLDDAAVFMANTPYYIYVRGVCDEENKGAWSPEMAFTTLCAPFTVEEFGTEDFTSDRNMACWSFGALTPGDYTSSTYAQRASSTAYGAYLELKRTNTDGTSYTYSGNPYALTPELNVDSINHYQVSFTAATTTSSVATNIKKLVVSVVTNPSDMDTETAIRTIYLDYAKDSTEEKTYVVSFKDYNGDYNEDFGRYVMFKAATTSDSTSSVLIDNISFELLGGCAQVTDMQVANVGLNSADLNWENTDATQYEVLVSDISTKEPDTLAAPVFRQLVAENHVTAVGLSGSTLYYAYVRAICGEGDTAKWSAAVSFKTKIGVPYFNALTDISDWTKYSGKVADAFAGTLPATTTSGWSVGTAKIIDGIDAEHPYYDLYGTSTNYWLVSPEIDMSDQVGNNIALSFNLGFTDYYGGTPNVSNQSLWVLVSTDNGATWSQANAYQVSAVAGADYDINNCKDIAPEITFYLSKFAGQKIRLAFCGQQSVSGGDNYIHLANIKLEAVEHIPFLGISGAEFKDFTLTSAKMHFLTKATDVATYEYKYCQAGSDTTGLVIYSSALDSVEISGLAASTTYDVYVRGISTGNDTCAWVGPLNFKTMLGIPYAESFNRSAMPADWTVMEGTVENAFAGTLPSASSPAYDTWNIYTYAYGLPANHLSSNLYYYSSSYYTTIYSDVWAVSPVIDMTPNADAAIQLSFDMAYTQSSSAVKPTATAGNSVYLLVSEDGGASWSAANAWIWNDSIANAAPSDKVDSIANIPNTGKTYTLDFSEYAGKVIRFAFYQKTTNNNNRIHIANVSLKELVAGCDDPAELKADSVGARTVVISFSGDELKTSIVELASDADFTKGLMRDTIEAGLVDTIEGLKAATTYYIRVKQLCDGGLETGYTKAVSIMTACETISEFPWMENFNGLSAGIPNCWSNNEGTTTDASYRWSYYYSGYEGVGLRFNSYNNSSNKTNFLATPTIHLPKPAELHFMAKNPAGGDYSLLIAADGGTRTTLLSDLTGLNNWTEYIVDLSAYVNQDIVLYFKGTSNYGNNDAYLYLDNVSIELLPDCRAIRGLAVDSIAIDSARVFFSSTGADQYQIVAATEAIGPDTLEAVAVEKIVFNRSQADTVAYLKDLEPQTDYFVYARGLCADGNGAWTEGLSFRTRCLPMTIVAGDPLVMDFEDVTASTVPDCWSFNTAGGNYPQVKSSSYVAGQGSKYVTFGGDSYGENKVQYIVFPELNNDISKLQLNFLLQGASSTASRNDSIYIGVMDNATDWASFTPVKGLQAADYDYHEHEILFGQYEGSGKFIAIKRVPVEYYYYSTYYYYGSYLDSIVLSVAPTCQPLQKVEVQNIDRRELDIIISAKEGVTTNAFDVVISDSAMTDADLEGAAKMALVDTNACHIDGLERETTYYIYARANCGGEDGAGAWSSVVATTKGLSANDIISVNPMNGTSSWNVPIAVYYHNSYVQSIYTPEDLQNYGASTLTSIAFNYYDAAPTVRNITIFMANVDEASFSGSSFIAPAEIVEVFTAKDVVFEKTPDNWFTMPLDQPFEYAGGNLLVAVYMNYAPTETGYSGTYRFYTHSASGMCCYATNDTKSPDLIPLTNGVPSVSASASSYRPNMQFAFSYAVEACPAVDSVGYELTGEGTESALISWKAAAGDYANTYDVFFCDSIVTDMSLAVPQYDSIAGLSQEITGLAAYTDYYVYVRCNCDGENHADGRSNWSEPISFRTNSACRVVKDLHVEATGKTTASVAWTSAGQAKNYQYVLSTVPMTNEELELATPTADAIADTFALLTGLEPAQKYYIYVANNCGEGGVSPYLVDSVVMPDGCPAVVNLETYYTAFNAVGLQWNRGWFGDETLWEAGIEGDETSVRNVTDSTVLFIGLQAETDYTFYVKAICGAEDSSMVATINVTTGATPSPVVLIGGDETTSSYAPVYGSYCDAAQRSQSVYPESMLESLKGQTINGIKYFVSSGSSMGSYGSWETEAFVVSLGITAQADMNAGWVPETLTEVYNGTLHADATDGMIITFSTPFVYEGGNLVISFDHPNEDGYVSCTFIGSTQSNASRYAYDGYSTTYSGIGSTLNFLPQVEFMCEPAACAKVAQLAVSDKTTTSVTVSWFPGGMETGWEYVNSDHAMTGDELAVATPTVTSDMKLTLSDLTPDHDYFFYIRALCSETNIGDWKQLNYTMEPTCFAPVALASSEVMTNEAVLSWTSSMPDFAGTYAIAYGKKDSFNLADAATFSVVMNVADTFRLMDGLEENTEYSFAVCAICGEGDSSRWSIPASFRTECGAVTAFPWRENFEAFAADNLMESCWRNEHVASTGTGLFKISTSTNATNATHQLQLPDMQSGNKTMLALPEMAIETADAYEFRMDIYRNATGTSYTAEGIRVFVSQSDTLDESAVELAFLARNFNVADNAHGIPAEDAAGWYTYSMPIPMSGNCRVILLGESQYGASTYMDNFMVRMIPQCNRPVLNPAVAGKDTALVSWVGNAENYIVEYSSSDNFAQIDTVLVPDTFAVLRGLMSASTYYVRVTGDCGEEKSDVSLASSFATSIGLPYTESFNASISQPANWTRLNGDILNGGASASTSSYGWNVTSSNGGGLGANHEYCGVSVDMDYYYPYDLIIDQYTLATPAVMLDAQEGYNVELSFDMSLTASYMSTTAPDPNDCAGREFAVVISTDGGDSWTRLATWSDTGDKGNYASIPASASNVRVDLTAYAGQSVMIGFYNNAGTAAYTEGYDPYWGDITIECATTYINLDNVKLVEKSATCMGVSNVAVSNVSFAGAKVDWNYEAGAKNAVIALSTSNTLKLENALLVDTVLNDSAYILPALKASTHYFVFVEQLCGGEETSAWEMADFQTNYGVRYAPEFTSTAMPSDWVLAAGMVDDVVAGTADLTSGSGWSLTTTAICDNIDFKSNIYGTSSNKWLITPAIDLTPNVGDGLLLSFNAGLTKYNYTTESTYDNADDRFVVLVTTDEGATWTKLAEWNNAGTGNYYYDSLTNVGKNYQINATNYAGQIVRFAFYGESTETGSDNDLHIGKIVLDTVHAETFIADVCDGANYDGSTEAVPNPFKVSHNDYHAGENIFSIYQPADTSIADSKDTMFVLTMMVYEAATYEYDVTVCEGDHYTDENFDLDITANTGVDQKLKGKYHTQYGCDSTVIMHLTINRKQTVEFFEKTCPGTPFSWNGEEYTLEGNYSFVTTSAVTGCDSTAILHLSYDTPSEDTRDMALCNGETYTMQDGTVVSASGYYKETATKATGCDSIINWHILIADEMQVAHDTLDVTELPYLWDGQEILTVSDIPGSHDVTIPMSCGDGVLRILITNRTDLKDIFMNHPGVRKAIINEHLVIFKDDKIYNAHGGELK